MSWLYTVVFAGLAMTSNTEVPGVPEQAFVDSPATVMGTQGDETEKFSQTYPFSPSGRVNVSNVNGSITVEAWDRSEVKLEYTKVADLKERLSEVEIRIDARADYFSVEADYPNNNWTSKGSGNTWKNGGKLNVEFRLMVPRTAVLNEIDTVNGSATVSNFTNVTKVSAVNGSVHALNLRGTAKLSTVNGEVVADFDRLEPGSKISLDSVNGSVRLLVPSDSNATVRADSLNGNIVNDFGLPVRKGKYIGRDMYGRLGKGGAEIKMDSVNGGLAIARKNDGKGLSPVTDLLPQKKNDGTDWDGDEHGSFKSAKIDKDVAKAIKESTKATSKALADTHVQLSRIQPEIAKLVTESTVAAAEAISQTAVALSSEKFKSAVKDIELQHSAIQVKMADAAFFPSIPRVEKKTETFAVKGIPLVTVNGRGCAVTVRGWDRSEVKYQVTQFTDPRNGAPIDITKSHTDSSLSIKVTNPSYEARDGDFSNDARRVLVEVFVPYKSNLKIESNGEIRIEGVSGDVQLTGSDEPVNVRDSDGKLRVSTSDGPVRVIGFRGEVEANTSDGNISLEGNFTRLGAHASEGAVTLTLPEGASADLEASCDEVQGDGIAVTKLSGDETRTKYRIGKGGTPFKVYTGGEIRVRGAGTLRETF